MKTHHLETSLSGCALTPALLAEVLALGCSYRGRGIWQVDDAHEAAVRDWMRRHDIAVNGCAAPDEERIGWTGVPLLDGERY